MALEIPPWLHGVGDLGEDYTRALQVGAQVKESKQRLAAEQQRTEMESQARAATLDREKQMESARLQTEKAYHQAQIGLRQQQLDQVAQVNAAKAKDAALKMADQQGFAKDLAGGMPIEQALFRHPRLSSPAAAIAAHKDQLDMAGQRLDLAKQKLDMQRQQIEDKQNAAPKPVRTGEIVTPVMDEEGTQTGTKRQYTFGNPEMPVPAAAASKGKLTKDAAKDFLKQAKGDKAKARQMAKDAGYDF